MSFLKRSMVFAGTCMTTLLFAHSAAQAAWPERPITVVLPTVAGSSLDGNIRKLGELMSKSLGQAIVIENKPGAGGSIALNQLARAAPDGYTIGIGNTASLSITPELSKVGYDVTKSFAYISRFTSQPNILVVSNTLPIKTAAELSDYAKKNPGKLSMGSQGNGSTGHLSGEWYKNLAGIDFVHVPYRGGPQAIQDLVGGRIDFLFENISTIEGQIDQGVVRPLAITTGKRSARFPDIPTMQEAGIKGYETDSWSMVLAPAGVPAEIVERLNKEVQVALADPAFKKSLTERGAEIHGGTSEKAHAFALEEQVKWRDIIRASGASAH